MPIFYDKKGSGIARPDPGIPKKEIPFSLVLLYYMLKKNATTCPVDKEMPWSGAFCGSRSRTGGPRYWLGELKSCEL